MSEKHGDGNNISAAHSINTLKTAAGRSRAIGHSANHGKHEVAAAGGSLNLMPPSLQSVHTRQVSRYVARGSGSPATRCISTRNCRGDNLISPTGMNPNNSLGRAPCVARVTILYPGR